MVTDTHPLVWYLCEKYRKLPAKVKAAFDSAVAGHSVIWVPSVVLWEMSLLQKAGKIQLLVSLDEYVSTGFFAKALHILPLETEDILRTGSLTFTRDPFDAALVALAQRMECSLITGDSVIHQAKPCKLFWD